MIVSHKHKFIYFAVPRTATHSVRSALAPELGAQDWQQEGLVSKSRLPIEDLARAGHGHIGVRALKPHLSEEQWATYYKFGMVRHPYDRFVSVCAFLNRDNDEFARGPIDWMLKALERERFLGRVLVRPQVDMLIDQSGELALDFVGRYEQLDSAMSNVAIRIGCEPLKLARRNSSTRTAVADYLSAPLVRALNAYYQRDFELLDYAMSKA